MTIKITHTGYSRMPHSINNHTDKEFSWNGVNYFIDKETDCLPKSYRLWKSRGTSGYVLELDYFCENNTWAQAIKFVEGFLTAKYGKQENQ